MASIIQTYFNIYFTEIIVGVLVISIAIVIVSIFYVIYSPSEYGAIKKSILKKTKDTKKIKQIKYTKQFIKGVDGIDLDLKVNKKPLK